MEFSNEELDFFSGMFSQDSFKHNCSLETHTLTVKTSVPKSISNVLGNAKLTLLAEISHYKLWFPLKLTINEFGQFEPILGVPEVIDNQLNERSWRVILPKNVTLHKQGLLQEVEILSLSSSGLTIRLDSNNKISQDIKNKELELYLSNEGKVKVNLETVRVNKNILAAKFKNNGQETESLRKFLFNSHRSQNIELYKSMTNS
jgi:hypothetical protein